MQDPDKDIGEEYEVEKRQRKSYRLNILIIQ